MTSLLARGALRLSPARSWVLAVAYSVLLALAAVIYAAPPAAADAPGPTDYVTTISGVEPPISGIELEVIGGDSFILMTVEEGFDVVVLGYESEPYLWFRPDGQVLENRASPATWANENRFGETTVPDGVSADADPRWNAVGTDGTYAWHDHRSHWMNPGKPLGAQPGDQILESAIPLIVSGRDVLIMVQSTLLAPPPIWPGLVGAVLGLAGAVVAWRGQRSPLAAVLVVGGLASLIFGYIAYGSVPGVTEPSLLLWLLPVVAIVAALLFMALRNRLSTTVYLDGLVTTGGVALAAWGITRFDAIRRALIPSDAPANLDRLVIAAVIIMGSAAAARGVYGLIKPERLEVAR